MYHVNRYRQFGETVDTGVDSGTMESYLPRPEIPNEFVPCVEHTDCASPGVCCKTGLGPFCMNPDACNYLHDYCDSAGAEFEVCGGSLPGPVDPVIPGGGSSGGSSSGGSSSGGGSSGGSSSSGGGTALAPAPAASLLDRLKAGEPLIVGVAAVAGLAAVALVLKATR